MRRSPSILSVLVLALLAAAPARSQDVAQWRPSTTEMPSMPTMAELKDASTTGLAAWFDGIESVIGGSVQELRATGTARGGSGRCEVARFLRGPVPVVVMSDRSGDGRADLIEYFRGGSLMLQVIDADYNGRANTMRVYDATGALLHEERL